MNPTSETLCTVGFGEEGESQIPNFCRFWGNLQKLANLHATLNWTVLRAQEELGVHI